MAKREIVIYTDDLTGKEGTDITSVRFAIDDNVYEIDLSEANRKKFMSALAPFMEAGRKVGKAVAPRSQWPVATKTTSKPGANKDENYNIRLWFNTKLSEAQRAEIYPQGGGGLVSERGRIPYPVMDAYRLHDSSPGRISVDKLTEAPKLPTLPTAEQVRNLSAKEAVELAKQMNEPKPAETAVKAPTAVEVKSTPGVSRKRTSKADAPGGTTSVVGWVAAKAAEATKAPTKRASKKATAVPAVTDISTARRARKATGKAATAEFKAASE